MARSTASPPIGTWLTIGEMARHYGITLRTLRYYEMRGLLNPRREGKMRLYGPTERHNLEFVQHGKRVGYTLTEISGVMGSKRPFDGSAIPLTLDEGERQLEHVKRQIANYTEAERELEKILHRLRPNDPEPKH